MNNEIQLRPEVLAFARLMEQRLREKDTEKGTSWKSMQGKDLTVHALSKMLRLEDAVRASPSAACARHAADLGNLCMMIADLAGALEQEAP